jgi:hypothetical protein
MHANLQTFFYINKVCKIHPKIKLKNIFFLIIEFHQQLFRQPIELF